MANAGIGFATGLLGGLTKNIAQNEQDQRLRALLQGDILGLGPEAGLDTTAIQGLGGGESGGVSGITSALGLTRTAGPSIESLIQLRGQLQARAKAEEQEKFNFEKITTLLRNGTTFSPEEEALALAGFRNPGRKIGLQAAFRQSREAKAFKDKFGQKLTAGQLTSGEKASGLWQMGEFKEAIKSMDEPFKTVTTPAGGVTSILGPGGKVQETIEGPARESTRTSAQEEADKARANYYNALAKSPRGGVMFNEFLRQGGNQDDEGAFLDYVAKRRQAGQAPPKPPALETVTLLQEAGKYSTPQAVLDAIDKNKLTPEIGKQILKQKFGFKEKTKSARPSNPR